MDVATHTLIPWRRFVALGDSITEGLGDPVPGYRDAGWVQLVADFLKAEQPQLEFTNLGRRGLTTAQIKLEQLDRAVALRPDLASVVVGGNDLLTPDFDAEQIGRDLEEMVLALSDVGATVFTCSLLNMPSAGVGDPDAVAWLQPRVDALRETVTDVAHACGTLFVDFWAHPASADPTIYSADLQHANRKGHTIVAEAVTTCLLEAAQRQARVPA